DDRSEIGDRWVRALRRCRAGEYEADDGASMIRKLAGAVKNLSREADRHLERVRYPDDRARLQSEDRFVRLEDMIQSRVERMRGGARQVFRGHPHRCLLRPSSSFADR